MGNWRRRSAERERGSAGDADVAASPRTQRRWDWMEASAARPG